jgi:hypothetical protein
MLKQIRDPEKNITLYVAELSLKLKDVEANSQPRKEYYDICGGTVPEAPRC